MVGNGENVLVESDYQNIVLVDPNKVVDSQGNISERLLKHENLVYYANLECSLIPRTRLSVGTNGYFNNKTISIASIDFLNPNDGPLNNDYLDEITGLNSIQGGGTNQTRETQHNVPNTTPGSKTYTTQSTINQKNTNLLLIKDIKISTPLNMVPTVTITMEDIRGRALFEQGENSPYSVFFNFPYPLFYLTVKGYLGKAIKYQLALKTFNARFDSIGGNFIIETVFMAFKYNVLTTLTMEHIRTIPYMYETKYILSPTNSQEKQSAQNQLGNTTQQVETKTTYRGYEKIKEVYSEYKNKGLIPNDFPEITLEDLIVRLETLETKITENFTKEDMSPIINGENFTTTLTDYEKDVFFARGESWFYKYMDTTNFVIDITTGSRVYTFNKQTIGNQKMVAVTKLKSLIEDYNKRLADNPTFGYGKTYKIKKDVFSSGINNNINYNTFTSGNTDEFFVFEGKNRFTDIIKNMQNLTATKIEEIQGKLSQVLSERLEDPKNGLGFRPTLKNVIAVILASSEAFLRVMCDVHANAWSQRENTYRREAILNNSSSVKSPDAKQSIETTKGNLIPVYPWPHYFVENNTSDGERYEITYPGDPKVVSKTKGYLFDVWPEIEFVEEYIKSAAITINPLVSKQPDNMLSNVISKVSFNALDYPTSNLYFGNRQESKFMYELWERVFLPANYQRFMRSGAENEIISTLAKTEYINLSTSLLGNAPFLMQKLKDYGFKSDMFIPYLYSISTNGLGESWQKYIRDTFVTNYINDEVNNSFVIYDETNNAIDQVNSAPSNIDKLISYINSNQTNEPNLLDTYPFVLDGWGKENLANGAIINDYRESYNTNKVYVINDDKKMVANYNGNTLKTEKRPITNFNYLSPTQPSIDGLGFASFYIDRTYDITKQQITEGQVNYTNYVGNLSPVQTTSILNTPMFINSILLGVDKWLTGNTTPFVAASYLLLNSLPISTLKEKYKSYNTIYTQDLDYIFSVFKKFGAIHRVPYAFVLKYGSIWHRYKNYVENGIDILDEVWDNFNAVVNYDPIGSSSQKTYSLILKGDSNTTDIVLENVTSVGGGSISEMNLGFYPAVLNKFNLFYKGSSLFTGYTNTDIQEQLNDNKFTLHTTPKSFISKSQGYDTTNPNDVLSVKTWRCTIKDNNKVYIVPSFGSEVNQIEDECFRNGNLIVDIIGNTSIFNGSVQGFWGMPNFGYFDLSGITKPSYTKYMKDIIVDSPDQLAFDLGTQSLYSTIEEVFSAFDKDILDLLETEFLNFSKSMYEYETHVVDENVIERSFVEELKPDNNGVNRNFQLLMNEMMSFTLLPGMINSPLMVSEQFTKINSTLKNFLEYDIIIKNGNPGGYNRRLFDSYIPTAPIEDKISFNYYIDKSLPTNSVSGITLNTYKSYNPETWKALEVYVGFSTVYGLEYTQYGSAITDFFIDMNIEFIPESVKTLAPLIKIYATQKVKDPSLNRGSFIELLTEYDDANKKFSNTLFDMLMQEIQLNLPNVKTVVEKPIDTALQGEQTKVELWETFKGINDTWISGYDYTQTTFLEDVLIMDRANRNIGDQVLIDPFQVRDLINNKLNPSASVYFYLESLLDVHHFICMMHPGYVNYYNVQNVDKVNTPHIDSSSDFGNNLFGTFLNVDTRDASPKLVCIFAAEPSKYLISDNNDDNKYLSDSFDLSRNNNPLTERVENKTDWALSNRVVGFNVDIGIRNQNIFYNFDVSQDMGKQTSESLTQMDRQINQYNGKGVATQNVSLWNYYKNRSYQCKVNMLGNAMIQPTMYFNLRHVPMFNGSYQILDVTHSISSGKFETSFTGIRQQVFALPKLESYMQMLTKKLFSELYEEIKQKVDTSKSSTTTNNNAPIKITGKIDNSQNCVTKLSTVYNKFTPGDAKQVSYSIKTISQGIINKMLDNGSNVVSITRLLSFVTIYLNSYSGNNFVSFNNNLAGVKLDYKWSEEVSKLFMSSYLCIINTNGLAEPYAEFISLNNLYELLYAKWDSVSTEYLSTVDSITEAYIRNWNRSMMSDTEYATYQSKYVDQIKELKIKIKSAIDLAKNMKILD